MNDSLNRIVIIGGGQAGGWAAKTLRVNGFVGSLVVIADEPYDFYERPPLSKSVLAGEADPEQPAIFSKEQVASLDIEWHRPNRAERIETDQRVVMLDNGERIDYDRVILATGSKARLPNPDWATLSRVITLRQWNDALELRDRLRQAKNLAVVGGGWIGLEVAATARELGVDVTVFEREAGLCLRSIPLSASKALEKLHRAHGVHLELNAEDVQLEQRGDEQLTVSLGDTCVDQFDLCLVGIGIELNLQLAYQAGLEIDKGILIDGFGRTSHSDILAVGDIARHPELGLCLQSWAHAQNQAVVASKALVSSDVLAYKDPAWLWSDQFDQNIQILGVPGKGTTVVRDEADSRVYFTLDDDQRLCQLVAFNNPRAVKLAKRWMSKNRILDPQALVDVGVSLMSLK